MGMGMGMGREVYWYLWISMVAYGYLWVFMGIYGCLWVIYLKIENIAYFLIQEPQKIREPQKTSEITHVL